MSEIRNNQKRKELRDLTEDLCDKLRTTLKVNTTARFCTQGIYQAKIKVSSKESFGNETNEFQGVERDVFIVNPLERAWEYYERYLDLVQDQQKVLFVATNSARQPPIGIPFYENNSLEKWFKGVEIDMKYLNWMRSVVIEDSESGRIFWGGMKQYFGSDFFRHCFVTNYCPLIFTNEERDFNFSLCDLDHENPVVMALEKNCRDTFVEVVKILKPDLIVSIGLYAYKRLKKYLPENYVYGDNFRSVDQPIATTYRQSGLSIDEKIEEWKRGVGNRLAGNVVWDKATKEDRRDKAYRQ